VQRYEASRTINPDEHQKLVLVTSKLCRYSVLFEEEMVQLIGPGVSEMSDRSDTEFDSLEDAAIYYVLLFESGLWPD
jgi:hypothetical protein